MYSPSRRSDTNWRHRAHSLAGCPSGRHANPASPESGLTRKHDETYKLIFSQRAAVASPPFSDEVWTNGFNPAYGGMRTRYRSWSATLRTTAPESSPT